MWIGTEGGGLNNFDRTREIFSHYTVEDGLANNVVQAILEDIKGRLWISTGNGLSQFNPKTEEFRNYDKLDGLQDNAFTIGAAAKKKNGLLYFGGINGLTVFHPDSVRINYSVPNIVITKFLFGGKKGMIDAIKNNLMPAEGKSLVLDNNQNDLYFEFAALD
jgi:ligand-binding sensor domain-containing protein